MEGSVRLQEWIHRLEVGSGAHYLRWILAVVAFAMLAVVYDTLCFRNFTNPEAMDAGQLARNIAEGRGYTTSFVRPFSMALISGHRADKSTLLKEGHPDISNAPVYPMLLAGLLRITPAPGDLTGIKGFNVAPSDMIVAMLNQALMGLGLLLVFRLALGWFDRAVAWTSAGLFALTEVYWRFSISGLSTVLLIDLVLLLVWLLSRFERHAREGAGVGRLFLYAASVGLVMGIAMLTRYSVGWLIVPVLIFIGCCAARRRVVLMGVTFCAFAVLVTPWLVRNTMLSGWPFGTATFALLQDTPMFPSDALERSLEPLFSGLPGHGGQLSRGVVHKGMANVREIVGTELARMGGNWLWAFFLVGLLVRFQNANLSRMRWLVLGAIVLMIPVQALTRTHLSAEAPAINSENLLVLFSPLVIVFGVGLFFVLLESLSLPAASVRYGILIAFVVLMSLPLQLTLLPPHPRAAAPPYYPPRIQQFAHYLDKPELLMSDVPWAVAWYGERQCVWMPLNGRQEFFAINDYHKTVNGLYVSTRTTDRKFLSSWLVGENQGWGSFLLQSFVRREIPDGFPLKHLPEGLFANGELLLMDRDRWKARDGGN